MRSYFIQIYEESIGAIKDMMFKKKKNIISQVKVILF